MTPNKANIWDHYKAPTLDEIIHKLSGATVFSKLDAKDSFLTIHLDTPSSYLMTFNTHKGCQQFPFHIPFGLKMSQVVFQMQMDHITDRLPGIITIHSDTCVYGRNTTEHDKQLLQHIQKTSQLGLVFNNSKCSICKPQISFYGAVFTAQGMKPDTAKYKLCKTFPHLKIKPNSSHFKSYKLLATLSSWPYL